MRNPVLGQRIQDLDVTKEWRHYDTSVPCIIPTGLITCEVLMKTLENFQIVLFVNSLVSWCVFIMHSSSVIEKSQYHFHFLPTSLDFSWG